MAKDAPSHEDDAVIVCRCEALTWGDVKQAMEAFQPTSLRQLKSVTRWGMGICQGRVCRPMMAATTVEDQTEAAFRLVVRPPFKPVAMNILGHEGEKV